MAGRGRRTTPALALALAVLAVAAGGCEGDGDSRPEAVREERRAKLPEGWERVVNRRAGFNLGVPPGWRVRKGADATLVRSLDRALAVSIAADRSPDGRGLPPGRYARRTAERLRGYRRLRVGRVRRVTDTRYRTAAVAAAGTYRRTDLRQEILVFALQKPRTATFTMIFFRSARVPSSRYREIISAMVRSLRAQTPR